MENGVKRPRGEEPSSPTVSPQPARRQPAPVLPANLQRMIYGLPERLLCQLLMDMCIKSPSSRLAVEATHVAQTLANRSCGVNFGHQCMVAWRILNTSRYTLYRGSLPEVAMAKALNAAAKISNCISVIADEADRKGASFSTRLSALEALRMIAKIMLLTDNMLGHEVRKFTDDELPRTMLDILGSMTPYERRQAGESVDGDTNLLYKVSLVAQEAELRDVEGFETLSDVYAVLSTGERLDDSEDQGGKESGDGEAAGNGYEANGDESTPENSAPLEEQNGLTGA
ncbi:hypothetical protein F4780DRAFT_776847 [Xylariomycetidae sp. FL0641]|nr:hypothetical protein F4780DRAFT_776847 [Xylariomycetidae sp. FL0641]